MDKNEISKDEYIKAQKIISDFFMELGCSVKEIRIAIDKYINNEDTEE